MHCLVMGGSGFVGHAIVRALLASGHTVTVLNRGHHPVAGVTQQITNRNNADEMASALKGQSFDTLIDTNCYTEMRARIVTGLLASRAPHAVVTSSAAVYRDSSAAPQIEMAAIGGGDAWGDYGRDKSAVEREYQAAGFQSCQVLRPPYIFGPNNNLDRETWFVRRLMHDRPLLVPGQGKAVYQFLHEDDLGAAVALCLSRGKSGCTAYNVAQPDHLTSRELAELFVSINGAGKVIISGDSGKGFSARDWFPFRGIDCAVVPDTFMTTFGWSPSQPLCHHFEKVVEVLHAPMEAHADGWSAVEDTIMKRLATGTEP